MKIVLTGGGTGGHIYPAISVGQALREAVPGVELLFIGSSHGPERELAEKNGIPFTAIPSSPLTKSVSFRNAGSLIRLASGVFRARRVLKCFGPDAVFGTGGYAAAAVLAAQWTLRGRVVIHEQNTVPGRTNRCLAWIADKVCVSFPGSRRFFPADKVVTTGMPVRREFWSLPKKPEARRTLGLNPDLFTLLVVGGSQGARKINDVVFDAWPVIDDGQTQVLHQVGARNLQAEQDRWNSLPDRYVVRAYLDMPAALAAADLVVGRSGASTLAEIAAAGVPSILVPYPYAYADHQTHNARYFLENRAALMVDESSFTPQVLADLIRDLRSMPERLAEMSACSSSLAMPDAADSVASVIIALAGA